MPNITVAGQSYTLADQFAEGQTIDAGAARALNTSYAKRLSAKFGHAIKKGAEASQATLDGLVASFSFNPSKRSGNGTGRATDPVAQKMRQFAVDEVKAAIVRNGGKLKDYPMSAISSRAQEYMAANEAALRAQASAVNLPQATI